MNYNNSEVTNKIIDDGFVRAVEYEYAVKYLEHLGIEPSQNNREIILKMAPFKDCLITPAWESSGELASAFNIYPAWKTEIQHKRNQTEIQQSKYIKELKSTLPEITKKYTKRKRIEISETLEKSGIPKLTIETIKKRYIYPFTIDSINCFLLLIVVKLKELGNNIDLVNTVSMELSIDCLNGDNLKNIQTELESPIKVSWIV